MSERKREEIKNAMTTLIDAVKAQERRLKAMEKRADAMEEKIGTLARFTKANSKQLVMLADIVGVAKVKGEEIITRGELNN